MDATTAINKFLDQIRTKLLSTKLISGIYLLFTFSMGGILFFNLYAFFAETPHDSLILLALLLTFSLIFVLVKFVIQPALKGISRENAALSAEKEWPDLKNSLINSYQLQKLLKEREDGVSNAMIQRLLIETEQKIPSLDISTLPKNLEARKNLNRFLVVLIIFALTGTLMPNVFTVGYQKLINLSFKKNTTFVSNIPPKEQLTVPSVNYKISGIMLHFNYPAYTRRESEKNESGNGKVDVLPGTEVSIDATSNQSLVGADLVINGRDAFSMFVEDTKISGTFLARKKGYYQFRIIDVEGNKTLLPTKYPINIQKDLTPRIIMFLSNPKPVYMDTDKVQFYYEGHDDFGIQSIDLLFSKNKKLTAKRIKTIRRQETIIKDGFVWNLSEMPLNPGDKIEYYLEIKDNDSVNGPNTGQSEIYSFSIFDSRKELDNLISMQDQLTDEMINLLADTLIEHRIILSGKLVDPTEIKKSVEISSDRLINIIQTAQKIYDQAKPIQIFSQKYLIFYKNIETELTGIRKKQIEILNKLNTTIGKTTPVGLNFPPLELLDEELIALLERDVLFLVKINNRQKMDQVVDLERQLEEMTNSLKEEFEKIQNKNAPNNIDEVRQKLKKMRQILDKIMEKLSRQTQRLPDEFINPDSIKQLNFDMFQKALDKIMTMIDKDNLDQAMEELEKMSKDLQTMANHFDQARNSMEEMVDMELMKNIDKSIKDLNKLQKEQKSLLDNTAKINQELRKKQEEKLNNKLDDFFVSLKNDVGSARNLLKKTEKFINNSKQLEKYATFSEKKEQLNQKLQKLRQETVDFATKPDIAKKFEEMNHIRREITDLATKKNKLQMDTYREFQNTLPEMNEKYDSLMEFAEMSDIREFKELFKKSYPMAFRWQHKLRMIPHPSQELSETLIKNLTNLREINAKISKKLGTMTLELKREYNEMISEKNKSRLRKMGKQQNQLRMMSEKIKQQISKMRKENPMIDPDMPSKISSAERYMKMAQKNLNNLDVPKSIDSENGALEKLAETKEMLNQLKNNNQGQSSSRARPFPKFGTGRARDRRKGGSASIQKERVDLPSEEQYKGSVKFRADILEAMKGHYPKQYERFVSEYYKELVK